LREHAKVQPDRWYYWADRLGILVWQDMPNMGLSSNYALTRPGEAEFARELTAVVLERGTHPSIVTWIPFNEGWKPFAVGGVTRMIKQLDPTRLVDSDSGSANCCMASESPVSDIRDAHLYFGPFAVAADYRASAIGEYGGVLPFAPFGHRWPGVQTSIGAPAARWKLSWVTGLLRVQYADLEQEMQSRGLSAAVFTELTATEQELGIVSYARAVFTIPPDLVKQLNDALIAASLTPAGRRPPPAAVPTGTTGRWTFDEGRGAHAGDGSGEGRPLALAGGAGWTRGVHGSALKIAAPGQLAVSAGS